LKYFDKKNGKIPVIKSKNIFEKFALFFIFTQIGVLSQEPLLDNQKSSQMLMLQFYFRDRQIGIHS
jgi:hypothetical protein